jgi:hypothetical protein
MSDESEKRTGQCGWFGARGFEEVDPQSVAVGLRRAAFASIGAELARRRVELTFDEQFDDEVAKQAIIEGYAGQIAAEQAQASAAHDARLLGAANSKPTLWQRFRSWLRRR